MVDFAPKLSSEVQPVQAVERTPMATGLLDIVQGFLPTKAPPAADTPDEIKKKDTISFYGAMDQAKQAREQGNTSAADRIARDALRTYGRKYGYNDTEVATTYQDFSGISISAEVNGTVVSDTELMKQPDYQGYTVLLQNENPNATPEEIHSGAINLVKDKMANDTMIKQIEQQKQVDWLHVEKVYTDKAYKTGQEITALINAAKSDELITPEEASVIRAKYEADFGGIQKPQGVSDTDWKSYKENYIDTTTTLVDSAIGIGKEYGIDSDTKRFFNQAIAMASRKGLLPRNLAAQLQPDANGKFLDVVSFLKTAAENTGMTADKFLATYNTIQSGSTKDVLNLVLDFQNLPADGLANIDVTEYNKKSPSEKRDAILANSIAVGNAENDPAKLAIDLNDIIVKTDNLESSPTITADDFGKIYNNSFFLAINKVYEANPAIGLKLANQAVAVIEKQKANIAINLNAQAKSKGIMLQGGKFVTDPTNDTAKIANDYVNKNFGGDWEKAIASDGRGANFSSVELMGRGHGDGYAAFQEIKTNIKSMDASAAKFQTVSKSLEILKGSLPQEEPPADQPKPVESKNGYKVPTEITQDKPFMDKVNSVSSNLGVNPNDMLRVIEFETGKSFDPAAKNPLSSATGLIQFMDSTAKGLGTTTAALANMSRADQMNYVAKYLEPYKGKIKNFGDLYMAVHWPRAIGKDESYVMYEKGSKEYKANINLDTNGDGTVTRGETIASVMSRTGGGAMMTPNTQAAENFRNTATSDITQVMPPSEALSAPTVDLGVAPTAPVASPEPTPIPNANATQEPTTNSRPNAPVASDAVQALVAKLSATPDQTFKTEQEFLKAVDAGELTAGESVVVDGAVYLIRKDGTPELIGNVQ